MENFTGLKVHFAGFVWQALVDGGANIETSTQKGCTSLMAASQNGHLPVVEVRIHAVSAISRVYLDIYSLQILNEEQDLINSFNADFGLCARHW